MENVPRAARSTRPDLWHASRGDGTGLEVVRRRRIFECTEANPGVHLRELARRVHLPLSTTGYHLGRLESRGLVVSHRDGRYKRYFAGHSLGMAEKTMLKSLRRVVRRRVVAVLLEVGVATQRELALRLGLSRSTLSVNLNELTALGVVYRRRMRPENGYLLQDPVFTRRMLDEHGASLSELGPPRVHAPLVVPLPFADGPPPVGAIALGGA